MPQLDDASSPKEQKSDVQEIRNLVNTDALANWLEDIATAKLGKADGRDEREVACAKWLMTVGRKFIIKQGEIDFYDPDDISAEPEWIQKALAEGKPVHALKLSANESATFERVLDWLRGPAGPALGGDWSRVSMPSAIEAESKWIEEISRQAKDAKLDGLVAAGTHPVDGLGDLAKLGLDFGQGYSWVELKSQEALSREGALMRHCVGIYGRSVQQGKSRIFSLRDPSGAPLATVEVQGASFHQLKTKGDESADQFCSNAAKLLIQTLLPQMRSKGLNPTCARDFVKTGYGMSNILGFCDLSAPLGEGGKKLVNQWILLNGARRSEVETVMLQAAKAGGASIFDALKGHCPNWQNDSVEMTKALFSNERMVGALEELLDFHAKRNEALGIKSKLGKRHQKRLDSYLEASIQGGPKVWALLHKVKADSGTLLRAACSSENKDAPDNLIAKFIEWIPVNSVGSMGSGQDLQTAALNLGVARKELALKALLKRLGSADFPWSGAARGATYTDGAGIVEWALEHAPGSANFSEALAEAAARGSKRCFALLAEDGRIFGRMEWALQDTAVAGSVEFMTVLEGVAAKDPKPSAISEFKAILRRVAMNDKVLAPESVAWLLDRLQVDPKFKDILSMKAVSSIRDGFAQEGSPKRVAQERILHWVGQHVEVEKILSFVDRAVHFGQDRAATKFWQLAEAKPDSESELARHRANTAIKAAELGMEGLFGAVGGTSKEIVQSKLTLEKALRLGCWGFASELASSAMQSAVGSSAKHGAMMADALIHAVNAAPIESIKMLLSRCDPKRSNSQALVGAARAGRQDVVELLAPLSDPKAQSSEALRSAAARGDSAMVEFLLPFSDAKASESQALRDAAAAGYWEVVRDLWDFSDPNAAAGEPLMFAARTGDLQNMEWMVRGGANPKAGGSGAIRALISKAHSSSQEAFDFLWERSEPRDLDAQSLLLATKGNRPEWVARIAQHVDVNASNCAALRMAAKMGELELMQVLIPLSDPLKASSIIRAEGFDDDGEAMLLSMIKSDSKSTLGI